MMARTIRPEQMGRGAVDAEPDLVADAHPAVAFVLGGDRFAVRQAGVDEGALAEPLDQLHFGADVRRAVRGDMDMLGAEAELEGAVGKAPARHPRLDLGAVAEADAG